MKFRYIPKKRRSGLMDAMHAVSESGGPYVLGFKASRSVRQVSMFQGNDYTKALNQLLQLELGTVALYHHCFIRWKDSPESCYGESHQEAARSLVNLIIANRGIPDKDGMAFPAEISIIIARLTMRLGQKFGQQTARKVCMQMEKMLRRRYHAALDMAPHRDHHCLLHLIYNTKKNLELLESSDH